MRYHKYPATAGPVAIFFCFLFCPRKQVYRSLLPPSGFDLQARMAAASSSNPQVSCPRLLAAQRGFSRRFPHLCMCVLSFAGIYQLH